MIKHLENFGKKINEYVTDERSFVFAARLYILDIFSSFLSAITIDYDDIFTILLRCRDH